MRNTIQPSGSSQGAATCRPSSAPSFGPADSPYIEHTRRDSRGMTTTRRYLKGQLLGKGGFAKCFKITDVETKKDWACKVVQKSSLTKQRHKVKVGIHRRICRCLWICTLSCCGDDPLSSSWCLLEALPWLCSLITLVRGCLCGGS